MTPSAVLFLVVLRSRWIHLDDGAFVVRALRLWNDLPEIRAANSVSSFKLLFGKKEKKKT